MIATPCYGGLMHVGYFRGLERVRASLEAEGWEYDFLVTEGESLVTRARNSAVAAFMATDFTDLVFIDADIEFEKGADLVNILKLPEIRGAAVAMKTGDLSEALSCWRDGERLTRAELKAGGMVQSVDYLGAAVMAIEKSVISQLQKARPELKYEDPCGGSAWALFEPVLTGGAYLSEDYGFCELARREGFSIYADPQCRVRHYGSIYWRW